MKIKNICGYRRLIFQNQNIKQKYDFVSMPRVLLFYEKFISMKQYTNSFIKSNLEWIGLHKE